MNKYDLNLKVKTTHGTIHVAWPCLFPGDATEYHNKFTKAMAVYMDVAILHLEASSRTSIQHAFAAVELGLVAAIQAKLITEYDPRVVHTDETGMLG